MIHLVDKEVGEEGIAQYHQAHPGTVLNWLTDFNAWRYYHSKMPRRYDQGLSMQFFVERPCYDTKYFSKANK